MPVGDKYRLDDSVGRFPDGIGGYLAFINMGLFQESSIPPDAQLRHLIIETVPIIAFIVLSVLFAYTLPRAA